MGKPPQLRAWDQIEYELAELILERSVEPETAIREVCSKFPAAQLDALVLAGSSVAAHFSGFRSDDRAVVRGLTIKIHQAILSVVLDRIFLQMTGLPSDTCGDLARYRRT